MASPFRDSVEARVAMLEEETAVLAKEVRELEARVPENQDAFLRRLEEQRDEARRELLEVRRLAETTPSTSLAPLATIPMNEMPAAARKWVLVGAAFVLGICLTAAFSDVSASHPRAR